MLKKVLGLLLFSAISISGYVWYQLNQSVTQVTSNQQAIEYNVAAGSSFSRVVNDLNKLGLIHSVNWIKLNEKIYSHWHPLKTGLYQIEANMPITELFAMLKQGKQKQFKLTFVEGSTLKQWLEQMRNAEHLKQTLSTDKPLAEQLGLQVDHLEGLFFPDTYYYPAGQSDKELLLQAFDAMKKALDLAWQSRTTSKHIKDPYQLLILASLIEKETGYAPERETISGVFYNRLNKKMRLQTDPTVIYGLGDNYKGNITKRHLRQYTPYNTYRINGLPPTPIAMPGAGSLHAAANPDKVEYLYFVSKGDGSHYFSKTLKEHNRAVNKYLRKR
ncbi:endolytic transglycosylase MltG [Paraferrimonas sp. SM1919]|uniref:endolytic transglycosylase MltG n=1 Tax=Paraferrimonas sp. SM1919 TaxID=2662263 RepID=UPI001F0898B1|nr:endolytic transglycosylase MltG [Paraferrimonas sp. SM1919]